MPFVIDASVAACWAFDDEDQPLARRVLDRLRDERAIAPALWWFEMLNIMAVNERRGRLSAADAAGFLRIVGRLGIATDRTPDDAAILSLARRHRLTAYDAAYLELALREGVPLATLDQALARAAATEGCALING